MIYTAVRRKAIGYQCNLVEIAMYFKYFCLIIIISITVGCSNRGLILRTSDDDGEGSFIKDCVNVSSRSNVKKYITKFYVSTWNSAVTEGVRAAEKEDDGLGSKGATRKQLKSQIVSLLPNPDIYCRAYNSRFQEVSKIIAGIMPLLGNDILLSDENDGVFETDFFQRQHSGAQWKDRYIITLTKWKENRTIVEIYRDLYIARRDSKSKTGYGVFVIAISSGHNEGWIMSQISNELKYSTSEHKM